MNNTAILEHLEVVSSFLRSRETSSTGDERSDFSNCATAVEYAIAQMTPVGPNVAPSTDYGITTNLYTCGSCQSPIDPADRYCKRCGKPIRWG